MDELIKKLKQKEASIQKLKQEIEKQLPDAPEGRIKVRVRREKPEYYIIKAGQEKYLGKDKMELICGLAQKSYLQNLMMDISKQLDVIQQFLSNYSSEAFIASYQKLSNERKKLVTPIYMTDEQYVKSWLNTPYTGKGFAANDTEIYTEKGERVRSKSEKMIADKLLLMGIPYKYECPLYLKSFGTIYPDFTILDVKERKEKYLEHFGLMDSPEYAVKACQKVDTYVKNGYIPGKTLILSFETSKQPLNIKIIEKCLKDNLDL